MAAGICFSQHAEQFRYIQHRWLTLMYGSSRKQTTIQILVITRIAKLDVLKFKQNKLTKITNNIQGSN